MAKSKAAAVLKQGNSAVVMSRDGSAAVYNIAAVLSWDKTVVAPLADLATLVPYRDDGVDPFLDVATDVALLVDWTTLVLYQDDGVVLFQDVAVAFVPLLGQATFVPDRDDGIAQFQAVAAALVPSPSGVVSLGNGLVPEVQPAVGSA